MGNQDFAETLTPSSSCQGSALRSPSTPPIPDASPRPLQDDAALWEPTTWEPIASLRPHRKKKPANHIPRPPNAFILFRSYFIRSQHVSSIVEPNHSTLSKIIGMTWKGLSDAEKEVWFRRAKKASEDHKKKWPKYTFRPIHGSKKSDTKSSSLNAGMSAPPVSPGNGGGGRRIREVEPTDDARCKKIADLLSSGLRGADLDDAIREFDQNHVPPVVTRFEAPLTAEEYANGTRKVKSSTTAPTYSQTATAASISTPYLPLRAPSLRVSYAILCFLQSTYDPTSDLKLKSGPSYLYILFIVTGVLPSGRYPSIGLGGQSSPQLVSNANTEKNTLP
ncbi:hypothetical protein ONZ45_g11098 [Pleurotus djamor]|nr:hypothetical protein ONZ45_g11098 [Pleurotus djamor]